MSVRIQLDKQHTTYTNLDFISGTVFLNINSPETISAITVKLEGESRSRLFGQPRRDGAFNPRGIYYDPYEKDQTQLEVHKVSKYLLDGIKIGLLFLTTTIATLQTRHRLPHAGDP